MVKSRWLSQSFEKVLHDLLSWFRHTHTRGLIIGGVAAAFLGRPRLTEDVDAVVLVAPDQWEKFLFSGKKFGFIPRISDPISFAKRSRMLLLKHKKTGVEVDISLGMLPFEEECVKRKIIVKIGNLSIPLPMVEDLIIMKAVAHRRQDLADIETLLAVNPKLNQKRIRKWVKEFSIVLDMPEIYRDMKDLLRQKPRN